MANPLIKKVVLDWETTAGTDPSLPEPIVLTAVESGITASRQTKTDSVIGGDIDSGGEPFGTFNEVAGGITTPLYFEQIGVLLKASLGDPTTVDNTGSYTHTFKSTECIPSFCIQNTLNNSCDGGSDLIERYNGLKAKGFSIDVSPDGDYNFSLDTVGMSFKDSITDSITELDETNKISLGATRIKNAHTSLKIDNVSYTLSKSFSMSLDRGTEATYTIGTGANAGEISDMQVSASGDFSSLFDSSVYTKAKNEMPVSFDIIITDGTNTLTLTIAEAKFSFKNEAKRVGEKYPLNLAWNGYKSVGTELLKVELTNNVASY
jgi:hypothetical protein